MIMSKLAKLVIVILGIHITFVANASWRSDVDKEIKQVCFPVIPWRTTQKDPIIKIFNLKESKLAISIRVAPDSVRPLHVSCRQGVNILINPGESRTCVTTLDTVRLLAMGDKPDAHGTYSIRVIKE